MTTIRDLPREYARALRKCTPQQQKWLRAMERNGFRAWKAAMQIGASEGSPSRWRREPRVQECLRLLDELTFVDLEVNIRRLTSELAAIATFDMRRLYKPDGTMLHPKDWDDDTAAAISGMDIEQRHTVGPDKTRRTELIETSKPRAYNKLAAIEALLNLQKLSPKRMELTGKDGKDLVPDTMPNDADIARRVAFLLMKGTAAAA